MTLIERWRTYWRVRRGVTPDAPPGALDATPGYETLAQRRGYAPSLVRLYPDYSVCLSCGWPWAVVPDGARHYTPLSPTRGCFAVCAPCWTELLATDPAAIFTAYRAAWTAYWQTSEAHSWDAVHAAVLRDMVASGYVPDRDPTNAWRQ